VTDGRPFRRLQPRDAVQATKQRLAHAAASTYPTAKALGRYTAARALRRDPQPVLVYQMGKVGSETVEHSLRLAPERGGRGILHLHSVDPTVLADEERLYRRGWSDARGASHIWAGLAVQRELARQDPQRRWDIVTLTRDPVARNMSAFFQVATISHGISFDPESEQQLVDDERLDDLASEFAERFDGHHVPERWFDDELLAHFGVDVYADPFPTELGYRVYETDRARVLVIRLEDLSDVAAPAFRDFLGFSSMTLREKNVGSDKRYGPTYRRFVQGIRLSDEYLDAQYGTRYATHFYRAGELAAFRAKWQRQDDSPPA
jgi:hypothetical protein